MQNLQLPTSQLFYSICHLARRGKLTDHERRALKKLVIIDYGEIFDLVTSYNNGEMSESSFQERLVQLSREVDMKSEENEERAFVQDQGFDQEEAKKITEYIERNPDVPDEIASPLGAQLWRRRRDQRNNRK